MFKRILVPTDGSEYSRRAFQTALAIARKFNAVVDLLFVMDMPVVYELNGEFPVISPQQIEHEGELVLKATLEGIDISGVTLIKKRMQGRKPAQVIIKEVENQNIDLVVMGNHGYGTITGSLLGSVSQYVLHRAKCSVFIAK